MELSRTFVDVPRPGGVIRVRRIAPAAPSRFPAVLFYSDIFQLTAPHERLAARLAGEGFLVLAPEIYGRFEPPGTVLDFERDRQRALDDAARVRVEDVDADRTALLDHLAARADVDASRLFVAGFCFGGHLAFRASCEPRVRAVTCFYPTTVHAETLGASVGVDTLSRMHPRAAPLLLVWGARDPHIPVDGRTKIEGRLAEAGARFAVRVFDAEHAFMRDEGPRYQPRATDEAFAAMLAHFAAAG
ncbi:MAG: dienelactone hydrolase family protein [Sandaracinus sp.]